MTALRLALLFVLTVVAASAGLLDSSHGESIMVSSTAAPGYVRPADRPTGPKQETYIFSPGKFFGGGADDKGLTQMSFTEVAKILAPSLAKQDYFPTRDVAAANLVIIVHWGTTLTYEDPLKQFTAEAKNTALADYNAGVTANGSADPVPLNNALSNSDAAEASTEGAINRNATLLGYSHTLEKQRRKVAPGTEEQTMNEELNEERYFVVLMAYDYQLLKKEHKPHLLWVTRMSVRSPGNNISEAMPALSRAGSEVFGKQVEDLSRVRTPLEPVGHVKLHELQVIGSGDAAKPDKPEDDKPSK